MVTSYDAFRVFSVLQEMENDRKADRNKVTGAPALTLLQLLMRLEPPAVHRREKNRELTFWMFGPRENIDTGGHRATLLPLLVLPLFLTPRKVITRLEMC